MLLIAGTIPEEDFPLTFGKLSADGDFLQVACWRFPRTQGTGAMLSAALTTTEYLGLEPPHALVAGDIGSGRGSREIYNYLTDKVAAMAPEVLALHYWLPDMAQTRRLCEALDGCSRRPFLIADAASMYAAKAAGLAPQFDIFTPDATEIAFLADPAATHPAYVQRHLIDTDMRQTPELIKAAYAQKSAARLLLVKGATDYIAREGEVVETVTGPDVPAMEAIGGTGDTITGMVAAFAYAELEPHQAAIIAARANRMAGEMAAATPATRVGQVIAALPEVFKKYLCEWSGVCFT